MPSTTSRFTVIAQTQSSSLNDLGNYCETPSYEVTDHHTGQTRNFSTLTAATNFIATHN